MRHDQELFTEYAITSASAKTLGVVQTTDNRTVASIDPYKPHPCWRSIQNAKDLAEVFPADSRHEASRIWAAWAKSAG